MPSKYGKEFAVPKEFPSVLKAFTREVLRSQPDNIYEFGAVYFTELVDQQNAAAHGGGSTRLSTEEIHDLLTNLFHVELRRGHACSVDRYAAARGTAQKFGREWYQTLPGASATRNRDAPEGPI